MLVLHNISTGRPSDYSIDRSFRAGQECSRFFAAPSPCHQLATDIDAFLEKAKKWPRLTTIWSKAGAGDRLLPLGLEGWPPGAGLSGAAQHPLGRGHPLRLFGFRQSRYVCRRRNPRSRA